MQTLPVPTPTSFTLDLRPPPRPEWIEGPEPWPQWLWLVGIAVGLLVLMAILRTFRRRPTMTPRELFQQQLAIVAQGLPTAPTTALTHLAVYLRQFLRAEFSLPAFSQTETELAAALHSDSRFNDGARTALVALLNDAATAKFAAGNFTEQQVQGHVEAVRKWVDMLSKERRA